MTRRDDEMRVRPGRIARGNKGAHKAKSYVTQVMRAAKKARHVGARFGGAGKKGRRSTFGRGRKATLGPLPEVSHATRGRDGVRRSAHRSALAVHNWGYHTHGARAVRFPCTLSRAVTIDNS